MLIATLIAYIVGSYVAVGWFVHTQLDGLLRVTGWFLWPTSPVFFPVLVLKALLGP